MQRNGIALACALLLAPALAAVLAPAPAVAGLAGTWVVRKGSLAYEVHHLLHAATGRTQAVQGRLECGEARCTFHLEAPVAAFDSGNAERDAVMRRTTQADRHPREEAEGTGRLVGDDAAVVTATLRLAGAEVALGPTRFKVEQGGWRLHVSGSFPVSLTDFHVSLPALLGIPISETFWIYVELELGAP